MAKSLKFLECLPPEVQEKVLQELSIESVDIVLREVEIDGKTYKAEEEVINLIDGLVLQLELLEDMNNRLRKKYEA
jgi:hypothetical protein|tara:strand:- start:1529 stop:1756 length:228 start_codon:yes stop_codon:yes gene_type:complete